MMKYILMSTFLFILLNVDCLAQCPDDISLNYTTQYDLDTFKVSYPNCQYLRSISLSNSSVDPILDLSGFQNLDSLSSDLSITGLSELSSLNGLQNLRRVRNINITDCSMLSKTASLEHLSIVVNGITLQDNPVLNDLSGFKNIKTLARDLYLGRLSTLTNLDGIQNISSVKDLTISECNTLESTTLLNNLKTISGDLLITNNTRLSDLGSFNGLEFVGGNLSIINNPILININGFNNLQIIDNGQLKITLNENLQNIEGFNTLESMGEEFDIRIDSLRKIDGFNALISSTIDFSNYVNLEEVSGFENLEYSRYMTFRRNPKLTKIPEFNQLDSIGFDLTIEYNEALSNFSGLESLKKVNGELKIFGNDRLSSMPSFPNLTNLDVLNITLNPSLASINGFDNISELNQISIDRNNKITSVPNFDQVVEMSKPILINSNPLLNNFPTFANLKRTYSFQSTGNSSIKTIDCCHELNSSESLFWFINYETLTSINGFAKLKSVGAFGISQNPLLESIPSFNLLESSNSYLNIVENPSLEKINGFNKLDNVSTLKMNSNGSTTIDGFQAYKGNNLEIKDNDQLISIDAFNNMEDGTVHIESNEKLTTISSFDNLASATFITIKENNNLINLDAFENVEEIFQDLIIIDNGALESISGFNNLVKALEIRINGPEIQTIPAFNSLKFLGKEPEDFTFSSYTGLYLEDMPKLQKINGFESLDTLKGWLHIASNTSLQEVSAFQNLSNVYRDLILFENDSLAIVDCFQNLEVIGSSYIVKGNNKLKRVPPTNKLQRIRGVFSNIFGTTGLEVAGDSISSIVGLRRLEQINGSPVINNTNLEDLSGLENLNPNMVGIPYIRNNPKLSNCEIAFLCEKIQQPNFICKIENNAEGCNDCKEISCLDNNIRGVIYYDFNENQVHDADEVTLNNSRIRITPDQVDLIPRSDGQYVYQCVEGKHYKISPQLENAWRITTDSLSYTFNFEMGLPENSLKDFGIVPEFDLHSGEVSLISAPTRCNTDVPFSISYQNMGTFEESGEISLLLDPKTTFVEASPSPSSISS